MHHFLHVPLRKKYPFNGIFFPFKKLTNHVTVNDLNKTYSNILFTLVENIYNEIKYIKEAQTFIFISLTMMLAKIS